MKKNIFNRISLLLMLMALANAGIGAKERTDAEMRQIALDAMGGTDAAKAKGMAGRTAVKLAKAERTYNIYTLDGAGSVIVSRDDRFAPVLAYAKGDLSGDGHSDGFNWWLKATAAAMEEAMESDEAPVAYAANWKFSAVEPLVKSLWGQESMPFNALTPVVGGNRSLNGCAAVVLSELLYYHKYPESASFIGSYTTYGETTFHQVNVKSTYDWSMFQDCYGTYSLDGSRTNTAYAGYSPQKGRAVAQLMLDCGYAVNMQFGPVSAAVNMDVPLALVNCFNYSNEGTKFYFKDFYSDFEWSRMIHDELSKGYPVALLGTDPEIGYGHIFVGHGWDENGLVAIEWGWTGIDNGYYSLDLLKSSKYAFTESVGMVTAHPYKLSTDAYHSIWVTDDPYTLKYNNQSKSLTISLVSDIYNLDKETFNGQVGIVFEKAANGEQAYSSLTNNSSVSVKCGYGLNATTTQVSNCEFAPNTVYYVYLGSKDERETAWMPIRTIGGKLYYTLRVDAYGNATFDDNYTIDTAVETVKAGTTATSVKSYSLDGRMVKGSVKGLVIERDGVKTRKVVR